MFFAFILQAYVYTKAAKIVGVEINADFCNIQNKIINKYNFQVGIIRTDTSFPTCYLFLHTGQRKHKNQT